MKKKNVIAFTLSALLCLSLLTACGGKKNDSQTVGGTKDGVTIVLVGVIGTNNEQWDTVNKLLEKDNIRCELVEYSAYNVPNDALNAKEIDLNAFQHKAYLNGEMESLGYELTTLCNTFIAPLSIYSDKITDLSQLKEGDKVAVPQDATNEGHCFKILESAGVLKVDPAAGYTPELKDITDNPLKLEFVEMEAAYTASSIPDVAIAFVNGQHAQDNGLNLADAVYTEQADTESDNPYINIVACRSADVDNEIYKKVAQAYQTAEVAQAIDELFGGRFIPAFAY